MKKLLFAFALVVLAAGAFAQKKHPNKKQQKLKTALSKYNDNVDDRMKGPHGEKIYIGANGGRYYLKNNRKVYVAYKGK